MKARPEKGTAVWDRSRDEPCIVVAHAQDPQWVHVSYYGGEHMVTGASHVHNLDSLHRDQSESWRALAARKLKGRAADIESDVLLEIKNDPPSSTIARMRARALEAETLLDMAAILEEEDRRP